ncbi:hypothetical protein EW093_09230 [Thiospirochaeta perfilievii]|uniref:Uncharacterized protein n=1 Tax=Thiospirochaeta perfilievii TaxID=252967 RepID=A0A5C1QD32_9SPIO|nr:DUF481 domain-containing protein [Thiospirochaeta perfilievii]QEN04879.1 hypothetical protein EW093_09230 [Thiospirochaeta perfilievii]
MKKIILISLLITTSFLGAKGILDYPLSNTEKPLYYTGDVSISTTSISWGKHQNLSISPNYFDSFGLLSNITSKKESLGSIFKYENSVDISLLDPSVNFSSNDLFSNFKLQGNFGLGYNFKFDSPITGLSFDIGPYVKLDSLIGYYAGIDNIMMQSLFALNSGLDGNITYKLLETVRFGLGYSTFIFGVDYGRNGYNKDFLPEVQVSTFGNYCDMKLTLYGELDISRTESLKLEYKHSVFSVFDDNNKVISGENSIGISVVKRLVR